MDNVSKELRDAEREIDNHFRKLPIIRKHRTAALKSFLAHLEALNRPPSGVKEQHARVDQIVNSSKWPIRWILGNCPNSPKENADLDLAQARGLLELGQNYLTFDTVYTLGSLGLVKLSLNNKLIVTERNYEEDLRYESYSSHLAAEQQISVLRETLEKTKNDVKSPFRSLNIYNRAPINPRNIKLAREIVSVQLGQLQKHPPEWQFLNFSLEEYRIFYECLSAIVLLHNIAFLRSSTKK